MTKEKVKEWMDSGFEIEFEQNGKQYSMGPFYKNNGQIFFCFGQAEDEEDIEFETIDNLWNSIYKGMKVSEIFESVPENQVDSRI